MPLLILRADVMRLFDDAGHLTGIVSRSAHAADLTRPARAARRFPGDDYHLDTTQNADPLRPSNLRSGLPS